MFFLFVIMIIGIVFAIKSAAQDFDEDVQTYCKNNQPEEEETGIKISIQTSYNTPMYSKEFIEEKTRSLAKSNSQQLTTTYPEILPKQEEWKIELSVTDSRSVLLKSVLRTMKEHNTYREYTEDGIQRYSVKFKKEELETFKNLYDKVKSLKGTNVFINGDLIEKKELSKILRCAVDRTEINNPDFCYGASYYTANPFGCHRITIRSTGDETWFNYTFFNNGRVFIDKKRIIEKISNDLKKYKYCPYLDIKKVWENFLQLPNEISLDDENFAVVRTIDGKIKVYNRWDMRYLGYVGFDELKEQFGSSLLSRK